MRCKILLIVVILLFTSSALAGQSPNYIIDPDSVSSGGEKNSSTNYSNLNWIMVPSSGRLSSANNVILDGFLSALAGEGDVIPPSIGNVRFDGEEVVNNDFIKEDAELTATVLDAGAGVSVEACQVVIDGQGTSFANLTSPSTYDAVSGALTYKLDLDSGTHTVQIQAVDNNNNSSSYSRTLKVETGDLKASSAFIYPNPFNPLQGPAKIAYQLNQDANVTLYLFNEINQLVWQTSFTSGSNGGKAGYNEVEWNGTTDFGETAPNGAYFLRIASGGKMIAKIKIAVLK